MMINLDLSWLVYNREKEEELRHRNPTNAMDRNLVAI